MRGVSEIYDSSRIFRKIEKALIFGFSRDLPLERKNIFRKTLYFSRSRDLPLEGESFFIQAAHFEFPHRLLFEGIKLFRETPTKTASLSGNK